MSQPAAGGREGPVRVVVVDDHAGVRAALAQLLNGLDDIVLVGEAADGEEATAVCRAAHPDVVLMDLSMPRLDGVEATRRIRAERPGTEVVILTASAGERLAAARAAGAARCVLKHEPHDAIIGALRAAAGLPHP